MAISPDGNWFISASWDQTLILWSTETTEPVQVLEGSSHIVYEVGFSPDGNYALSSSGTLSAYTQESEILMWSMPDGDLIRRLSVPAPAAFSLSIHPNAETALSGSTDGQLITWRIDTFEDLLTWITSNRDVESLSCSTIIRYQLELDC